MRKKLYLKTVIRFFIVGGSATFLDFILYVHFSTSWGLNISKTVSTTLACLYSYVLNKHWTFDAIRHSVSGTLWRYIVVQFVNVLINTEVNFFVFSLSGEKLLSFCVAVGIATVMNFWLQRFYVFR